MDNHVEYIFIDESGDLGKFGSRYFTIVALTTNDIKHISRIIKRLRERRLKKKLKELPEIKANNSDDDTRRYILTKLAGAECSISAIAIPKIKIRDDLFENKEKLYNFLSGMLFEHITLRADRLEITIDKKNGNRLLMDDFNQYLLSKILKKWPAIPVNIKHLESHASNELQAVDFVAWAINRRFCYNDFTYYDLIKSRIKNTGKEEIWNERV
ncbi:MAG: DUF3800 domain-containing protein [Candidatus Micrarchaeia archaeon]|jgi:hypothetical protein